MFGNENILDCVDLDLDNMMMVMDYDYEIDLDDLAFDDSDVDLTLA